MAQDAFAKLIPVLVDTPARAEIINLFFDLLSAIAAHWKTSGMTGLKLSRMSALWAFALNQESESEDRQFTFAEGHKAWQM